LETAPAEQELYAGIEYVTFTGRYAAFTNKRPPFPHRNLIGTFSSLDRAIEARKTALVSKEVDE